MKMMYDKPELINKMFTQEMVNDMSNALKNKNMQEMNALDQKITNSVLQNYNKLNEDDKN